MTILPPLTEPPEVNRFAVLYWNQVGLQMNRMTHSIGGPQGGPTMSSRALGLLHLAMHDAFFATLGHTQTSDPNPTYLNNADMPAKPMGIVVGLEAANAALTGAAITVLDRMYGSTGPGVSAVARNTLVQTLSGLIADYGPHIDTLSPAHRYGADVAKVILARLAVAPGDIGADAGRYEPRRGRFFFGEEPEHPVRLVPVDPNNPAFGMRPQRDYHGPYYGSTVKEFAVTDPAGHRLAPWPMADYPAALAEVHALGGAPTRNSTTRTPDETVAGLYWAYDGPNLIGTPPRLYNQILRVIAWEKRDAGADPVSGDLASVAQNSEFVRLFALANTAMADAGKFSWTEKYKFELWRPLSGIRDHDTGTNPGSAGNEHLDAGADPFWLALGAPDTNSNRVSFKPPFPAYPSGHATFGAACFQMARLFYKAAGKATVNKDGSDNIAFSFVSEELDGINRDLAQPYDNTRPITDQPGLVRTRINRRFGSLWRAIFENAFSRIYLGVHWRFDAFDARDALRPNGKYKEPDNITYSNVWTSKRPDNVADADLPIGGVPLGLGIANDIFDNKMRAPAPSVQPAMAATAAAVKSSNTTFRN